MLNSNGDFLDEISDDKNVLYTPTLQDENILNKTSSDCIDRRGRQNQKEKERKEKIKHSMGELTTLIPPEHFSEKKLSHHEQLQYVVQYVKTLQYENQALTNASVNRWIKEKEDLQMEILRYRQLLTLYGIPESVDPSQIVISWRYRTVDDIETSHLEIHQQQQQFNESNQIQPAISQSISISPTTNNENHNLSQFNNQPSSQTFTMFTDLLNAPDIPQTSESQTSFNNQNGPQFLSNNASVGILSEENRINNLNMSASEKNGNQSTLSSIDFNSIGFQNSVIDSQMNKDNNLQLNDNQVMNQVDIRSDASNGDSTCTPLMDLNSETKSLNHQTESTDLNYQLSIDQNNQSQFSNDQANNLTLNYNSSETIVKFSNNQQQLNYDNSNIQYTNIGDMNIINNENQIQGNLILHNGQLLVVNQSNNSIMNSNQLGACPQNSNIIVNSQQNVLAQQMNLIGQQQNAFQNIVTQQTNILNQQTLISQHQGMIINQQGLLSQNFIGQPQTVFGQTPAFIGQQNGLIGQQAIITQNLDGSFRIGNFDANIPIAGQNTPIMLNNKSTNVQAQPFIQNASNNMNQMVTVNTPQGPMIMNTLPSKPNEHPQALILPDGQIVPVVTQPNLIFPTQQCIPVTGSLIVPSISQQRITNNLAIATPISSIRSDTNVIRSKKKSNISTNSSSAQVQSLTAMLTADGNVILSFPSNSDKLLSGIPHLKGQRILPKPINATDFSSMPILQPKLKVLTQVNSNLSNISCASTTTLPLSVTIPCITSIESGKDILAAATESIFVNSTDQISPCEFEHQDLQIKDHQMTAPFLTTNNKQSTIDDDKLKKLSKIRRRGNFINNFDMNTIHREEKESHINDFSDLIRIDCADLTNNVENCNDVSTTTPEVGLIQSQVNENLPIAKEHEIINLNKVSNIIYDEIDQPKANSNYNGIKTTELLSEKELMKKQDSEPISMPVIELHSPKNNSNKEIIDVIKLNKNISKNKIKEKSNIVNDLESEDNKHHIEKTNGNECSNEPINLRDTENFSNVFHDLLSKSVATSINITSYAASKPAKNFSPFKKDNENDQSSNMTLNTPKYKAVNICNQSIFTSPDNIYDFNDNVDELNSSKKGFKFSQNNLKKNLEVHANKTDEIDKKVESLPLCDLTPERNSKKSDKSKNKISISKTNTEFSTPRTRSHSKMLDFYKDNTKLSQPMTEDAHNGSIEETTPTNISLKLKISKNDIKMSFGENIYDEPDVINYKCHKIVEKKLDEVVSFETESIEESTQTMRKELRKLKKKMKKLEENKNEDIITFNSSDIFDVVDRVENMAASTQTESKRRKHKFYGEDNITKKIKKSHLENDDRKLDDLCSNMNAKSENITVPNHISYIDSVVVNLSQNSTTILNDHKNLMKNEDMKSKILNIPEYQNELIDFSLNSRKVAEIDNSKNITNIDTSINISQQQMNSTKFKTILEKKDEIKECKVESNKNIGKAQHSNLAHLARLGPEIHRGAASKLSVQAARCKTEKENIKNDVTISNTNVEIQDKSKNQEDCIQKSNIVLKVNLKESKIDEKEIIKDKSLNSQNDSHKPKTTEKENKQKEKLDEYKRKESADILNDFKSNAILIKTPPKHSNTNDGTSINKNISESNIITDNLNHSREYNKYNSHNISCAMYDQNSSNAYNFESFRNNHEFNNPFFMAQQYNGEVADYTNSSLNSFSSCDLGRHTKSQINQSAENHNNSKNINILNPNQMDKYFENTHCSNLSYSIQSNLSSQDNANIPSSTSISTSTVTISSSNSFHNQNISYHNSSSNTSQADYRNSQYAHFDSFQSHQFNTNINGFGFDQSTLNYNNCASNSLINNKRPSSTHQLSDSQEQSKRQSSISQTKSQQPMTLTISTTSSSCKSSNRTTSVPNTTSIKQVKKPSKSITSTATSLSAFDNSLFDGRCMTPFFGFSGLSPNRNLAHDSLTYLPPNFLAADNTTSRSKSLQHRDISSFNPSLFPTTRAQSTLNFQNSGFMNDQPVSSAHSSMNNQVPAHMHHSFGFGSFFQDSQRDAITAAMSPIKFNDTNSLKHSQIYQQNNTNYNNRSSQLSAAHMLNDVGFNAFLNHQHPGFDARNIGGPFAAHGHHSSAFGMSSFNFPMHNF